MHKYARNLALATLACLPPLWHSPGLSITSGAEEPAGPQSPANVAQPHPEPDPSPDPSQPPETRPQPAPVRTVSIAVSGDVLIHDNVWNSAARAATGTQPGFDFRPMLSDLRPRISAADLAICHLEVPLAPRPGPFSSYPLFSAPPQVVDALRWVGYDACSTASNHSVDQGFLGVKRTVAALDEAGLKHTGTASSPDPAPVVFAQSGMRIAWLSYTYGTNGMPVDADKPWSVNLIDVPRIRSAARDARRAGADAVIVALHWGDEYAHDPSAYQLDIAKRLTRGTDVSLVYGHHAHVVQPIRKINGTWVIFGLGNLLAGQGTTAPGVESGIIGKFTLRQRGDGPVRIGRPTYAPTYIDYSDSAGEFKVYDVRRALGRGDLNGATRAELAASRAQTDGVMTAGGD